MVDRESNRPDNNKKNHEIEIELMKRDISMLIKLCEKFDVTIERMQQVTTDLARLVYLSEKRLETQEKTHELMENNFEKAMEKNSQLRIEAYNEFRKTLEEQKELLEKNQDYTEQNKNSLNMVNEKLTETLTKFERLKEEVSTINVWRYMMMGGIALGVFLLTKAVDVFKLFR